MVWSLIAMKSTIQAAAAKTCGPRWYIQCTIPYRMVQYGTVVVKSPIVVHGVGGISCEGCSPVITLSRPAGDLTMQSYLLSLHPSQCITLSLLHSQVPEWVGEPNFLSHCFDFRNILVVTIQTPSDLLSLL